MAKRDMYTIIEKVDILNEYCMTTEELKEILTCMTDTEHVYSGIFDSFKYGYAMGLKAAKRYSKANSMTFHRMRLADLLNVVKDIEYILLTKQGVQIFQGWINESGIDNDNSCEYYNCGVLKVEQSKDSFNSITIVLDI